MIRGLYSAAAGMLTAARRMEFVTNNLANAQTVGYKQERTATATFAQQLLMEQLGPDATPNIGTLSTATVAEEPMLDFTQGSLEETGRALDLAPEGPGFFAVQGPGGVRYTRDGSFTRDAFGRLTTSEGDLVLGENGPIEIPGGRIVIDPDGSIAVEGQPIDRLLVVEFGPDQPLQKMGNNQFAPATSRRRPPRRGCARTSSKARTWTSRRPRRRCWSSSAPTRRTSARSSTRTS
jgi:flagellar basal-body rod protein FlgF